jgi:hypothetical protein
MAATQQLPMASRTGRDNQRKFTHEGLLRTLFATPIQFLREKKIRHCVEFIADLFGQATDLRASD